MKFSEHLFTALQGFAFGSIIMAYINNYNRSQLPFAFLTLIFSILLIINKK